MEFGVELNYFYFFAQFFASLLIRPVSRSSELSTLFYSNVPATPRVLEFTTPFSASGDEWFIGRPYI